MFLFIVQKYKRFSCVCDIWLTWQMLLSKSLSTEGTQQSDSSTEQLKISISSETEASGKFHGWCLCVHMVLHTHPPQLAFILTHFQFVAHTQMQIAKQTETVMRGNCCWNWRHVNGVKGLTFSFNRFLLGGFGDYPVRDKPDAVVCF